MFSLSTNYSFYAIPVIVFVAYIPGFWKNMVMAQNNVYNNVSPRRNITNLQSKEKSKLSPELTAKIVRMDGAHSNGLENLPFFIGSILAANYAKVETENLNIAAGLYVALRVLYTYLYITHTKTATSFVRTFIFTASFLIPFYLSIKAAGNLAAQ